MNDDVTASPPDIEAHGSKLDELATQIRSDFDSAKGNLDCTTEGLNTPAVMEGITKAWESVCHTVASEVRRAADGTTQAGQDHSANEAAQTEGMNKAGGN